DGLAPVDRGRRDHRGAAGEVQGVPAHGDLDDRGGRADRQTGRDAEQDRRLLRPGGGRGGGGAAQPDGAGDDRGARRDRGRHGGGDVPADLRHDEHGAVGARPRSGGEVGGGGRGGWPLSP